MGTGDDRFQFLDPSHLSDGVVRLSLAGTHPAEPERGWVPWYEFHICSENTGERAGEIHLRIGNTAQMRLYGGHVAYGVRPAYRGNRFAARAIRMIMPLATRHGLTELWITCNPENIASRRTCEYAGAEFAGIVDLPHDLDMYQESERRKCRYHLLLEPFIAIPC